MNSKRNGFNDAQLVARGVVDSLEELDRVLCELDDARREPRVIAVAWQEGFHFQVPMRGSRGPSEPHKLASAGATPAPAPNLPQREVGETPNLRGYNMGGANRPKDWAGSGNKPLMRSLTANVCRPLKGIAPQNLWQSPPVSGAESNTTDPRELTAPVLPLNFSAGGGAVLQSAAPSRTYSPPAPADTVSVVCPWCALERAYQGQGPAPRTGYGYARVKSCARHSPVEVLEHPTIAPQQAVARDASPQAPAAALLLPGSAGAEPFHPVLNPNAGVRPAYPKGRWS